MKCRSCQYGELAPRDTPVAPWQAVAVDCISPWVFELCGGKEIKVLALTTIDIATNLVESDYLSTKTSMECTHSVETAGY